MGAFRKRGWGHSAWIGKNPANAPEFTGERGRGAEAPLPHAAFLVQMNLVV